MEAGMMSRGPHLLHSAPPQCLNGPKSNWFIFDLYYLHFMNKKKGKLIILSISPFFIFPDPPQSLNGPKRNWFIFYTFSCLHTICKEGTQSAFFLSSSPLFYEKMINWYFSFYFSFFLLYAWMGPRAIDLFWISIYLSSYILGINPYPMPKLNPNEFSFDSIFSVPDQCWNWTHNNSCDFSAWNYLFVYNSWKLPISFWKLLLMHAYYFLWWEEVGTWR